MDYFYLSKPEVIRQIFSDYREKGKMLYKLPDDLKGQSRVIWSTVKDPEAVVVDLRSTMEVKEVMQSKTGETFKTKLDIWSEKPIINSVKKTKLLIFYPSVHKVGYDQILYISPS